MVSSTVNYSGICEVRHYVSGVLPHLSLALKTVRACPVSLSREPFLVQIVFPTDSSRVLLVLCIDDLRRVDRVKFNFTRIVRKTKAKNFECFLAHDWGTKESGFFTHNKVLSISRLLKQRGVSVWVDENQLRGNIVNGICEGIESSRKVVVFLTNRYMTRLESPDNNCTMELKFAVREKKLKNVIAVVLDAELLDYKNWTRLARFYFAEHVYIDFTTEKKIKDNLNKLVREILV